MRRRTRSPYWLFPVRKPRLDKRHIRQLLRNRGDVNHVVGERDQIGIVLDQQNAVPLVTQANKELAKLVYITSMQTGTWFIKDIGNVSKATAEMTESS